MQRLNKLSVTVINFTDCKVSLKFKVFSNIWILAVTDCNQMDSIWQDVPVYLYCCFFPLKYKQIQSINIRHIKLSQLLHMSFQQILYVCDDAPTSLKHGARCHDSSPAWLSLCAVSALTPQLLLSRLKQSRALFWKQRRSLSVPTPVKFTAVHPECLLVVQQV